MFAPLDFVPLRRECFDSSCLLKKDCPWIFSGIDAFVTNIFRILRSVKSKEKKGEGLIWEGV